MKKIIFISFAFFLFSIVKAESISPDSCRKRALNNYPLIKQYGLIEQAREYNLALASKAWLPQVNLAIRASYQSEVTEIPAALGNAISSITGKPFSMPSLSRDQYQAVAEVNQLIWDGGQLSAQKASVRASAEIEKQKTEVELYNLNERINNLYFGILLLREQIIQQQILQKELNANLSKIETLQKNGLVLQADLDAVKVEIISAKQRIYDLHSLQKNYCIILSAFTGLNIQETTVLEKPETESVIPVENNRPELKLFAAQQLYLLSQEKSVYASNLPKIGAFVQGGYGRPGLNMFTTTFSPFYIGGIRLSWNLSSFYSAKANLGKINISRSNIDILRETFLFNNQLSINQHQTEIEKLKEHLKTDDEIIALRANIRKTAESKLANGTITVTDLIREINAEHFARQQKALHEIQLCMAVYQLKNDTNQY